VHSLHTRREKHNFAFDLGFIELLQSVERIDHDNLGFEAFAFRRHTAPQRSQRQTMRHWSHDPPTFGASFPMRHLHLFRSHVLQAEFLHRAYAPRHRGLVPG